MIGRKRKNNQAKERQELSPSDLAYFTPELKQAQIELDKRKNAMNDFFLQAMTQGIEIKLENEKGAQWRSVKDELPQPGEVVLVFAVGKYECFIGKTKYALCQQLEHRNGEKSWTEPWEYFSMYFEITHWMPLPEPPKVEENKV